MNAREKARFFHECAQLVKGGVPFPKALSLLVRHARGTARTVLVRVQRRLEAGDTVAEALEAQEPLLDSLETGILAAGDRAGRLEHSFAECAAYYEALAAAQARIKVSSIYPLFVLHLAVLAFNIERILPMQGGGTGPFLHATVPLFALIWLLIGLAVVAVKFAGRLAGGSTMVDGLLNRLPITGGARRGFALSRFCSAYNMQLEAGVNVFTSLAAAGRASGSAILRASVLDAVKAINQGAKLAEALGPTGAFPEPVIRGFLVGEEVGQLDKELARLAEEYRLAATARLNALSEWLPRLLYLTVAGIIAWKAISFYAGYFRTINEL